MGHFGAQDFLGISRASLTLACTPSYTDSGTTRTTVSTGPNGQQLAGLTDANWSAFSSLQQTAFAYDSYGRATHQRAQAGGSTHSLVQVSYDASGRQDCVATRMNPSAFASPPASACTLGTPGAFGSDRITKYGYDAAGQLTSTISGYGSGSPITESATYTANGKPLILTDGKGNVSTMVYDGFDRLSRIRYPNASGGGSSTTDYEEYGYDAGSNVTSYRNRAGELIGFAFDALNRQTVMGGSAIADRTFAYDLMNRLTSISYTSGGAGSTRTWDALGRMTSETQNGVGTVSYGYDLAGRRTSMQWPDGFWAAYDYNLAGELTAVRENGATNWNLAWFGYDNLGRRTVQGNANGANTSWGYDGAGRLTSLSHDLAGTANDLTLNFSYNPAGQIATRTMSNTAYAYTPGAGSTGYVNNGKNQVTAAGGTAIGYDARQNITSAPMGTYGYNGANELTSATVGGTTTGLSYDPAGRLYQSGSTRFLYDGDQAIGEYNTSGGLLRRYVPGVGLDSIVTAYEGAGATDRRYPLSDERQSVISITNGSAGVIATNTYDEYGVPGAGNSGRFQYTGQMWLPEAQLYHYRAKAYAPTLGRFMQTDPIGYQAGANLYAYVGADPVNFDDPSGLQEAPSVGDVIVNGKKNPCGFGVCVDPDEFGRLYRNEDGGGAPRSGGSASRARERNCIAPTDGPVYIVGGGLDLNLAAGAGFALNRFSIPSIGAEGWVFTGTGSAGLGGSAGVSVGVIDTVGQWLGKGYRFELAFGPGSLNLAFDSNGNYAGGEFGLGAGGGVYGGVTKTRIKSSNMPLCGGGLND